MVPWQLRISGISGLCMHHVVSWHVSEGSSTLGISMRNHPAIGYPHDYGNPSSQPLGTSSSSRGKVLAGHTEESLSAAFFRLISYKLMTFSPARHPNLGAWFIVNCWDKTKRDLFEKDDVFLRSCWSNQCGILISDSWHNWYAWNSWADASEVSNSDVSTRYRPCESEVDEEYRQWATWEKRPSIDLHGWSVSCLLLGFLPFGPPFDHQFARFWAQRLIFHQSYMVFSSWFWFVSK